MTTVLEGILVVGPYVAAIFQGPKGNEVKELWLATKGFMVMLGGMEDEVLDPSSGMWAVDGLDVIWGGIEKVVLLDANRGFDGAEK